MECLKGSPRRGSGTQEDEGVHDSPWNPPGTTGLSGTSGKKRLCVDAGARETPSVPFTTRRDSTGSVDSQVVGRRPPTPSPGTKTSRGSKRHGDRRRAERTKVLDDRSARDRLDSRNFKKTPNLDLSLRS